MALMKETVCICEKSVYFYNTTRRHIPEGYFIVILAAVRTRNLRK
jgi:hypothetical protein